MLNLTINGDATAIDVAVDMPLLWVLRDYVGLTGTKYGCGIGICGACTVLINGQAMRSCQLPAAGAVGQEVTTIEGLSQDGTHPLQRAWRELDVAQCGYCQAGQLMAAAALLRRVARPSDADIDAAITNICRCGTYQRIRAAIHLAVALTGTRGL